MARRREFVNPERTRNQAYREVLKEIQKEGKCPFCPGNFNWHREPIICEFDGWLLTKASWPYENAKHHFLLIPKEHKEELADVTAEDFKTIVILVSTAFNRFNLKGAGLAVRFGSPEYTGASVKHIHFHLISPEIEKGHVDFPIG